MGISICYDGSVTNTTFAYTHYITKKKIVSEKEQKKNFIRENMKQLKYIQGKIKEPKFNTVKTHPSRLSQVAAEASLGKVKSSPSSKSGQISLNMAKNNLTNSRKKQTTDIKIKKGDMAEFLKRKELLKQLKPTEDSTEEDARSTESSGRLRDIGCQTVETNLAQKLEESTKITMLYPKKDEDEAKLKASGDSVHHRSPCCSPNFTTPRRAGDAAQDFERPRSRLNAIQERKAPDNKDPFLPSSTLHIIFFTILSYTVYYIIT